MSAIRGRHTKSTEIRLRMALVRAGLTGWKLHFSTLPGKPDIYFPKRNVAVFVDGCFWHGCRSCGHIPKTNQAFWEAKIRSNSERDRRNKRKLSSAGISVVRIWEHSLKDRSSAAKAVAAIRIALATCNSLDRKGTTRRTTGSQIQPRRVCL
ncbi:MAG: very short patch repair endonuclease [Pyrinomonadaceae bacterium]